MIDPQKYSLILGKQCVYHGVGVTVFVGVGVADFVGVGVAAADGVAEIVGLTVGFAVGLAVACGFCVGAGVPVADTTGTAVGLINITRIALSSGTGDTVFLLEIITPTITTTSTITPAIIVSAANVFFRSSILV